MNMSKIKSTFRLQSTLKVGITMRGAMRLLPALLLTAFMVAEPTPATAHEQAYRVAVNAPLAPLPAAGPRLPRLEAESLDGAKLVFPEAAKQKRFVFIVCYERKCADEQKVWWQALESELKNSIDIYAVVDAVRAPSFIRGMIKRGIVSQTTDMQPRLRSHFLLNFKDKGWKSISPAFSDADAPAIIVVDANGSIAYSQRQRYEEASFARVIDAIRNH